jgi:hypothetical protein
LGDLLNYQVKQDTIINNDLKKGYTFDNPYVIENPFKLNPLSAMIIFNTNDIKSVKVSINDSFVFNTEESKVHVIPVYGLYSNSINIIKLELDGNTKEVEVKTSPYDNSLENYQVVNNLNGKTHLYVVGDLNSDKSMFRVFDKNNNVLLYMDFAKFTNFDIDDGRLYLEYKINDSLPGITLEVDYMGKIYSVTSSYDYKNKGISLNLTDKSYYIKPYNFYPEIVKNYKTKSVHDTDSNTYKNTLFFSDLENELDNALTYKNDYLFDVEGSFIFFKFEEEVDELLVITEDSNYVYSYDVKNINMIKHDITDKKTFFIKINDKYYKLNNVIE